MKKTIIALSGGVDSVVLLHDWTKNNECIAVHVNHELQSCHEEFEKAASWNCFHSNTPLWILTRQQSVMWMNEMKRIQSLDPKESERAWEEEKNIIRQQLKNNLKRQIQRLQPLPYLSEWLETTEKSIMFWNPDWKKTCQCWDAFQKNKAFQQNSSSIEAMARAARYWILQGLACDSNIQNIALAHHQDDAIETRMIAFCRGQGLISLLGLQAHQHPEGMKPIIRPFLNQNKASLIEKAKNKEWIWFEDPSNEDTTLRRNGLRHQVLPLLKPLFPQLFAPQREMEEQLKQLLEFKKEWLKKQNEEFKLQTKEVEKCIEIRKDGDRQLNGSLLLSAWWKIIKPKWNAWNQLGPVQQEMLLQNSIEKLGFKKQSQQTDLWIKKINEWGKTIKNKSIKEEKMLMPQEKNQDDWKDPIQKNKKPSK